MNGSDQPSSSSDPALGRAAGEGGRDLPSVQEHEAQIAAEMREHISEYVILLGHLADAIREVLNETKGQPLSPVAAIQTLHLARLQGDVRVCQWMITHGYAMAAASYASVIFELAFRALYLRDSNDRAQAWIKHEERHQAFPPKVKTAISSFHELIDPKRTKYPRFTEETHHFYQELCLAKHGNPLVQRSYGIVAKADHFAIQTIPYIDETTIRACRVAALHSSRPVRWLLLHFAEWHLPKESQRKVHPVVERVGDLARQLAVRDGFAKEPVTR